MERVGAIVAEVYWINGQRAPHLAIVQRPQGAELLEADLEQIKESGVETLVCLLEPGEAVALGLAEEGPAAEAAGLNFVSFPIPDRDLPQDEAEFRSFVAELAGRLQRGEHVGVHCRGCIGRSTVTAACALVQVGWSPQAALMAIAHARGVPVPDTPEQESWILEYEAHS